MSLYTNYRQYIDTQVKAIDPDLDPLQDDQFGELDWANTFADKFYRLVFGDITLGREGSTETEVTGVTLTIAAERVRVNDTVFDDLICKAIDIKNEIISPLNIATQSDFTDIEGVSIAPTPLDSDDKTITVVLEFSLRRDITF